MGGRKEGRPMRVKWWNNKEPKLMK
jgi:hypothetical protein